MNLKVSSFNIFIVLFVSCGLSGCLGDGSEPVPDLYEVTGVITWDGEPLEGAKVIFEPEEVREKARRRASSSTTEADGTYKLYYNPKASGATPGKHKVIIFKMPDDSEEPGEQLLPAKYNEKTELTADVTEGPNEINFDLKSN